MPKLTVPQKTNYLSALYTCVIN